MRKSIRVNRRKSAVNFPLFVIVPRLGKNSSLGVLCVFAARPVEYSHGQGVSVAPVTVFHGASPVEYLIDRG